MYFQPELRNRQMQAADFQARKFGHHLTRFFDQPFSQRFCACCRHCGMSVTLGRESVYGEVLYQQCDHDANRLLQTRLEMIDNTPDLLLKRLSVEAQRLEPALRRVFDPGEFQPERDRLLSDDGVWELRWQTASLRAALAHTAPTPSHAQDDPYSSPDLLTGTASSPLGGEDSDASSRRSSTPLLNSANESHAVAVDGVFSAAGVASSGVGYVELRRLVAEEAMVEAQYVGRYLNPNPGDDASHWLVKPLAPDTRGLAYQVGENELGIPEWRFRRKNGVVGYRVPLTDITFESTPSWLAELLASPRVQHALANGF